jgi:TetR/AcrR family transcriptional regulator
MCREVTMVERLTGEERRRVIVEAAVALFSQKGFRGTTTKEIAQAAGCSEATIFKHFATKNELYSAILETKSRIDETVAKAAQAAARKDDAGVFRAVGLESLTRTEQDPSLMRLAHYLLIHEIFGVKRPAGLLPEHVIDTFVALFLQGIRR